MNLDVKDKVGVYLLHNQITDETYIGSGILDKRKFVHNNSLVKNKHFNKKLQSETALKLFKNGGRTAPWLNKNIPDYYKENISKTVKKHWESLSKEQQQKKTEGMINALEGNTYSVGRIVSEETRSKLSIAGLGKIRSEESRNNISKGKTGISFTDEHCKNLSVALTGKKQSPETIKKRSDSLKRYQLIKKGLI